MGRKNRAYVKSLNQQAYEILVGMQAFGESKKEAIKNGTEKDKIFSYRTYKTYWARIRHFLMYVQRMHPECTTLKKAKRYMADCLQEMVDNKESAWTISTEKAALTKLFQIEDPNWFEVPSRRRKDIKRSRTTAKRDEHFSVTNNAELIDFCRGTGLRRCEFNKLYGKNLVTRAQIEKRIMKIEENQKRRKLSPAEEKQLSMLLDTRLFEQEFFVYVVGKGGRERLSPIIGPNTQKIVERFRNTGRDEKVWLYVNSNADIHGYRAEYATAIYKANARRISDIPYDRVNKGTGRWFQSEVYVCRKDETKKQLDKAAMLKCSKALGHNRICVVADNYLREI